MKLIIFAILVALIIFYLFVFVWYKYETIKQFLIKKKAKQNELENIKQEIISSSVFRRSQNQII